MLVTVALVAFIAAVEGEQYPTPGDLVAGYRYNLSTFNAPRIIWRYVDIRPEAWYDHNENAATQLDRTATASTLDAKQRAELQSEASARRSSVAATASRIAHVWDYWTDRERFQVRTPSNNDIQGAVSFPDDPITPATLTTTYGNYRIFSYLSNANPPLRFWTGIDKRGTLSGILANGTGVAKQGDFLFPPLGACKEEWGVKQFHWIDAFYVLPAEQMQVVGKSNVAGHTTYLLRHQKLEKAPPTFTKLAANVEIGEATTAWVDPARGCIPLRIEWSSVIVIDGKSFGDGETKPFRVMETEQIEQFADAGFYPAKGSLWLYGADPHWAGTPITLDEAIAGKKVEIPLVTISEHKWDAAKVEPNAATNESMFAFTFPANTHYFDETKGRFFIEGLTQSEVDRIIESGAGAPPPALGGGFRLLAVLSINAAIVGAALLAFRSWRNRARK